MSQLRAAVVGVGYLGSFHAQKYQQASGVDLVAVCDAQATQARKVAETLKVKAVATPKDLIGQVDMVTIATTTRGHFEVARMFIEAGIPVNVEKPICATLAEAEKLVDLAAARKTLLCVGHIERFNPTVNALKAQAGAPVDLEFIRKGPFKARGADVSVLHDLMIHDYDLMTWLGGADVADFKVSGTRLLGADCDTCDAFFVLKNGVKARVSVSRVSPVAERRLQWRESARHWIANTGAGEIECVTPGDLKSEQPMLVEKKTFEKADALLLETQAFVSAVKGEAPPVVDGEAGLAALRGIENLLKDLTGQA